MTKRTTIKLAAIGLGLVIGCLSFHAKAQPVPSPCGAGTNCKVLTLTATRKTGAAIKVQGGSDAGIQFNDGTIQTTAASVGSILPDQTGNGGKYLSTDGGANGAFWNTIGASGSTITYAVYASRPAAGTSGNVFLCSNCPVGMWVDSGASWLPLIKGIPGVQPKAASNFTALNRVGGTVPTLTDNAGSLYFQIGTDSSNSLLLAGFYESVSSSSMHVEAAFDMTQALQLGLNASLPGVGVMFRESASGKVAAWHLLQVNTNSGQFEVMLQGEYWASPTSRSFTRPFSVPGPINGPLFLRLRGCSSGTVICYDVSTDGQTWLTPLGILTSTIFNAAPNQAGISLEMQNNTDSITANILSYNSGT